MISHGRVVYTLANIVQRRRGETKWLLVRCLRKAVLSFSKATRRAFLAPFLAREQRLDTRKIYWSWTRMTLNASTARRLVPEMLVVGKHSNFLQGWARSIHWVRNGILVRVKTSNNVHKVNLYLEKWITMLYLASSEQTFVRAIDHGIHRYTLSVSNFVKLSTNIWQISWSVKRSCISRGIVEYCVHTLVSWRFFKFFESSYNLETVQKFLDILQIELFRNDRYTYEYLEFRENYKLN